MSYQRRKSRVGRVIGDKMDKSCIVEVEWRSFHRRYKKSIRRRSRFKAHDENNTARIGDTVTIIESRPMSKTKRWRLVDIVERQEIAEMPSLEISLSDEVEASMPDLVVEETVSQEEEVSVQAEVQDEPLDEAVTSAEDAPADSEDDEAGDGGDEVEASEASEEAMDTTPESVDEDDAPADEASESEQEIEETAESADEEAAPSEEEDGLEEPPAATAENAEDGDAAAGENEAMDEKADEEKPRQ